MSVAACVLILTAQCIASYTLRREDFLPSPQPLAEFPSRLGEWVQIRELAIDPITLDVLGPDDILNREYTTAGGDYGALFVAYYRTQLRSKQAHDPKVCLPGSGWNPISSRLVTFGSTGGLALRANYYRIAKGSGEAIVLYWFQTHKGLYRFEQELRAHRLLDSILDNRTDMALVRIVVPVDGRGLEIAESHAIQLAQLVYPQMLAFFPPAGASAGN